MLQMLVPLLGVALVACTGAVPHVTDQWKHPGVFLHGRVRGGGALHPRVSQSCSHFLQSTINHESTQN